MLRDIYFLKIAKYLAGFFLFWVFLGWLDRLVFLIYFYGRQSNISWLDLFATFWNGLQMDFSMAAYISIVPFLVFFIRLIFLPKHFHFPDFLFKLYTYFFIVFFVIVSIINIILYTEWSEKISFKAVDMFLLSPKEAVASISIFNLILLIGVMGILIWLIIRLFHLFFQHKYRDGDVMPNRLIHIPIFLILAFFLFSCIRGGYGRAPLNPSMAYFSNVPFLNHSAVNTHWYLMDDVLKYQRQKNPFMYMDMAEADSIVQELYSGSSDDSLRLKLFERDQPNIVMVVLEGFTADLVASLKGESDIAPGLEKIIAEGVLFDQVYAVAERSDKGIVGIFSGFPAQGPNSVIRSVNKLEKLPVISEELKAVGYHNSFYYGGQSEFYNLKSYVMTHQFDRLVDKGDFDRDAISSSWGVYDEVLFDKHLQDMNLAREPFFSTIYTLTNHHPFELPGSYRFGQDGMANQFRSTAFYTDSVLMDYLQKSKKTKWYANTVFVIVADHGHRLPGEHYEISDYRRHHIPLVVFGEPLKPDFRGKRISRIGSQADIAKTLLRQLKLSVERYKWSNDLLDPNTHSFAFFNWQDGFGILTEQGFLAYDFIGDYIISQEPDQLSDESVKKISDQGKAMMQLIYQSYLDY